MTNKTKGESMIKGSLFGEAFDRIRLNTFNPNYVGPTAMRLPHWSTDVKIKIQIPDENSKMTAPYLYVESRFGRVPWKETMIELFSDKWELVD
jgi:hypothetical protein